MLNGPSDETSVIVRNTLATAALGLFGWHLVTLHNIAKSVDVLVTQMSMTSGRIERLENFVYFKDGPNQKQVR
jgi:DMSO/TMAO reductase YedYZ heme-binding membrane subunit